MGSKIAEDRGDLRGPHSTLKFFYDGVLKAEECYETQPPDTAAPRQLPEQNKNAGVSAQCSVPEKHPAGSAEMDFVHVSVSILESQLFWQQPTNWGSPCA